MERLSMRMETVLRHSPRKIDHAAFFQLRFDGPLMSGYKDRFPVFEKTGKFFCVHHRNAAFAFPLHPPAGKNEDGTDSNRTSIEGGEFFGQPCGISLRLFEPLAVEAHRVGKVELLTVENHLVALLSLWRCAARLAARFGFNGKHSGGSDNHVIDIPRLLARLLDFHVVEDVNRVGGELVENLPYHLLPNEAKPVVGTVFNLFCGSIEKQGTGDETEGENEERREFS